MTYAADALFREVAYVAYYFHWTRDEILDLSHLERRLFLDEIGSINASVARGR